MARVLTLATAGINPQQQQDANHPCYPRVDYLELQRFLKTDTLDYTIYSQTQIGGLLRYLETQLRSDLYLASIGLLKKIPYELVFAMSERVGIPFATLNRFSPYRKNFVTMFTCWSARQERFITRLNLLPAMDGIAVHCRSMKENLVKLGARPDQVHLLHYGIDHHFFSPLTGSPSEPNFVVSVGEVRSRDYKSLFAAAVDLPAQLTVAASGNWYAREKKKTVRARPPANTTIVSKAPLVELRKLYARAQFVVAPVYDTVYSAGATVVLEAAGMGRPTIAFRSQGIVDYIVDGETGILTPPGDVYALREAMAYLLAHPQEARRLGENARQLVAERFNLDNYVAKIADFLYLHLHGEAVSVV